VSVSRLTLLFQLIQCSGIYRSTTGAAGSTNGRTINVAGTGTGVVSNQGDAEGEGGRADPFKVEGQGKGVGRRGRA
jgi:hypothetical protein